MATKLEITKMVDLMFPVDKTNTKAFKKLYAKTTPAQRKRLHKILLANKLNYAYTH